MREIVRWSAMSLAASIALAGCTTIGDIDSAIKRNLSTACAGEGLAYEVFAGIADSFALNESTLKLANDAHAAAGRLCANPDTTNAAAVTIEVVRLSAQIARAIAEAKRVADAAD